MNKGIKHNRPIATVLKEYLERKRGKVSEAKNELHRRFDYLDWNIQKKIIVAHLQSTKSERQWVYPRLLDYWDASFVPVVKSIWETYHEDGCVWSIIHYFPKEYILANLATLGEGRNYYFICLRFADDKDFIIDKSKLSAFDYLSYCQKTDTRLESEEALSYLYEVVIDCVLDYEKQVLNVPAFEATSPLYFSTIRKALWFVESLQVQAAVHKFKNWCKEVEMVSDKEWREVSNNCPSYIQKNIYVARIILKNMGIMLSKKILDRFIKINPNLQKLIEKLELEVDFKHIVNELIYD